MEKKPLHLLILEDNPDDAELAVRELEKEGFVVEWNRVETEKDFRKALENPPDLVLADYALPSFNGISALNIHQKLAPEIPLIIISGTIDEEIAVECMKCGAADYVLKDKLFRLGPVVKRALEEAEVHRARRKTEEKLKQSFDKLGRILEETVNALASAVGQRDPCTADHQRRVTKLACAIANEMDLSGDLVMGIRIAGLLHDIGKISVPAEILSKPSRLTTAEFDLVKVHPQIGYDILKAIEFPWPVAKIVLQHHERLNGSGYPQGLRAPQILLSAKIIGVADVVEAMCSHRPYRPAPGLEKALEEITQNKGKLYDPDVVDTCIKLFKNKDFKFASGVKS
jgi:putative nucleotidyltransferase with HDIG domain